MALPPSGPISLSMVNVELGHPATQQISLGSPEVRALAEVPSGPISMSNLYGKSSIVNIPLSYTTNTANLNIDISQLSGYVPGKTKVTIDIAQDIYIYSTNIGNAGLRIGGGTTGDEILINNHGFIIGCGGSGGAGVHVPGNEVRDYPGNPGGKGGVAINMTFPVGMNNYNTIGGGGGGGGAGKGNSNRDGAFGIYIDNYGGGGGGGGQSFGAAGAGGTAQPNGGNPCPPGQPGGAGTLTGAGGGGGSGGSKATPGASGGLIGVAGNPAPGSSTGGASGDAIYKNGNVLSLYVQGVIKGAVI